MKKLLRIIEARGIGNKNMFNNIFIWGTRDFKCIFKKDTFYPVKCLVCDVIRIRKCYNVEF